MITSRMLKALPMAAVLAVGLAGCGTIYTSPDVDDGGTFGQPNTDFDVTVVPMTVESTLKANLTVYVPQRLPFGLSAESLREIAQTTAINIPNLSPLPPPPSRPGVRPVSIPDRLPPPTTPEPYTIGVADVLLLSADPSGASIDQLPAIISAQSKRQGFIVQDDGAIAIPDAGRVRVAGLTMQDAEAVIFQALVSAGIDPTFTFEITEFNSKRVSIGGAVRQPMLLPITLKPLYLHEALAQTGGLTVTDPQVAKIQLFRGGQTYQISAERFIDDPAMREIVLLDGDAIFVESEFEEERARARFSEEVQVRQQQIASAQFAAQQLTAQGQILNNQIDRLDYNRQAFLNRLELGAVDRDYAYLTGEVRRPARYPLPFETKAVLADVMLETQGINIQHGDFGEVYVLRRSNNPNEASRLTAYHLDASNAVNLALTAMFEVHPGDVVFVAEQPVTTWNRAISQILPNLLLSAADIASGF